MSLADELLNDFEDGEDEDNLAADIQNLTNQNGIKIEPMDTTEIGEAFQDFKIPFPVGDGHKKSLLHSVRQVAKLRDSDKLQNIIHEIEKLTEKCELIDGTLGPVEANPEYKLIVEANNIFVDIENEVGIIYKFVKEKYAKRFPELESLVLDPLEYLNTVRELGNYLDRVTNSELMAQTLTQATIMVVSVTASTTQGVILSNEEMNTIEEACHMAKELGDMKTKIFEFVQSRMSFIAPNLSAIVGASTAAKLMGAAGGIMNLAKMPACNIMLVGKQHRTSIGMGHSASLPHTGHIYYCNIVQETPPDLRHKAARLVSGKAALAVRIDASHGSPSGAQGVALREDVEKKLDKMQEPPPVKAIKPLPAPIDAPGKRRGGRRVRKMKERMAITDARKAANRMSFGDIEDDAYQDDLGYTRGQLGKGGAGRVRKVAVDEKTRVRLSKTLQKEVARQNTLGGATTVRRQQISGTASSVAFTPLQGLEIVNPHAAEKAQGTAFVGGNKYFSNVVGFKNVHK